MNENSEATVPKTSSIPTWFWVVGVLVLLWNLLGLMAFVMEMTMTAEAKAELPQAQQDLYAIIPAWVKVCFAAAVLGGVAGSVLMLAKKRWAVPVFMISLIGVLGQNLYMFFLSDTVSVMGAAAMVLPAVVVLIAIVLVPYARFCVNQGYLK